MTYESGKKNRKRGRRELEGEGEEGGSGREKRKLNGFLILLAKAEKSLWGWELIVLKHFTMAFKICLRI